MKHSLLIFVKNAVKGKVKTRLAATLGDHEALAIYQRLLVYTEKCAHSLLAKTIVFYSDYLEVKDTWNDSIYKKQIQTGNDLGERMKNAFEYAFENGSERVVIIGSDCFEITSEIIESAFLQLEHFDVVIGPALDGGYYLLALKAPCENLFQNIEWSTDMVLSQTMHVCQKLGLKTTTLQELSDIDNESDLIRMGDQ
ncbi:MAG: TIGR04282 family arsenosugar biosynthesis glycosyltransferase [Pedobacter sp.]|uniref:TIGR04282 family arsenosugar biosynthesis glycosyltransferase n=1 Tax=Pedobacter sp. JCM 36344 TaxID=3374280 RepID=UPI00198885F0|nr:TIGR04282 family arsenosugar biosynthesis glycosyltransferase [Pedobacter sp.]